MRRLFLLCISLPTIVSCQKNNDHDLVNETNINLYSPTASDIYIKGDTVFIKGEITSATGIHGYQASVLTGQGDTLYNIEEHAHGKSVVIDKYWVYNTDIQNAGNLQLVINAIVDHDGRTVASIKNIRTK